MSVDQYLAPTRDSTAVWNKVPTVNGPASLAELLYK